MSSATGLTSSSLSRSRFVTSERRSDRIWSEPAALAPRNDKVDQLIGTPTSAALEGPLRLEKWAVSRHRRFLSLDDLAGVLLEVVHDRFDPDLHGARRLGGVEILE